MKTSYVLRIVVALILLCFVVAIVLTLLTVLTILTHTTTTNQTTINTKRPVRLASHGVASAHVINLDKSPERLQKSQQSANRIGLPLKRWVGVFGADVSDDDWLQKHKASHRLVDGKLYGVLGCYLSHLQLLRYCGKTRTQKHMAHWIFEDDIEFSQEIWDAWDFALKHLPDDWDVAYFGASNVASVPVEGTPQEGPWKLHRPDTRCGNGAVCNFGTWAYAVRHGAIATHILPALERSGINDPIDVVFRNNFSNWRVFYIVPSPVLLRDELSIIDATGGH